MSTARNFNTVVALREVLGGKAARDLGAKRSAQPMWEQVKVAVMVRLEARLGKENELAEFLRTGLSVIQQEPQTVTWFAIRLGKSTFLIFGAFTDEPGRQGHLAGRLTAALKEKSRELLAKPPVVEKVDVLAAKLASYVE